MQQTIQLRPNLAAVTGVEWIVLPGTARNRTQQKRAHAKVARAGSSLELESTGRWAFGVAPGRVRIASAAAWLALSIGPDKSLILIKELNPDTYWLCAIYKGLPLARGDRILPRSALLSALDDLVISHDKSEFEFVLDPLEGDALQMVFHDYAAYQVASVKDLVGTAPPAKAMLLPAKSKTLLFTSIGLASMFVAGSIGYWQYQVKKNEELQRQLAMQEQAKLPPDQVFMNNFTAHYTGNPRYPAPDFLAQVYERVRSVDLEQSGWDVTKISCKASQKSCVYELTRKPFSGWLTLPPEHFNQLEQSMDGAKATATLQIVPRTLPPVRKATDLAAAFPAKVASAETMIPQFQTAKDFGLAVRLDPAAPIANVSVPDSPVDVQEGKWAVSGSVLALDVVRKMNPSLFYADSIDITPAAGALSFNIEGTYLVSLNTKVAASAPAAAAVPSGLVTAAAPPTAAK
jgi:hypothetical protein